MTPNGKEEVVTKFWKSIRYGRNPNFDFVRREWGKEVEFESVPSKEKCKTNDGSLFYISFIDEKFFSLKRPRKLLAGWAFSDEPSFCYFFVFCMGQGSVPILADSNVIE
jgi:hypothetical protein